MSRFRSILIVVLGVAALAIPAAAVAKHANHGHHNAKAHHHGKANGRNKTHAVAYVFKGLYAGEGTTADEGLVEVMHGNSRVRKGGFIGETVSFDLSNARIVVADVNGDGQRNLEDVATGDRVVVIARLPRKDPGSQPFVARRLIDQTHRRG